MITVRFPSGFSIQYNDAGFVYRSTEYSDLYKSSEKKHWIAQVPNSCVIELVPPCRTYNPVGTDSDQVNASIATLSSEIRLMKRKLSKLEVSK
jgi:hypothetical protein